MLNGVTELPLRESWFDRWAQLGAPATSPLGKAGYEAMGNYSTTTFGSILGDVSSFVNNTFLPVYTAIKMPQLGAGAPVAPAPAPGGQPAPTFNLDLRSLLLIAGVATFGVAVVLLVRKGKR